MYLINVQGRGHCLKVLTVVYSSDVYIFIKLPEYQFVFIYLIFVLIFDQLNTI